MGYTKSTDDLNVHQSLSDAPNVEDGISAEVLKQIFDGPANKLQDSFNNLIDELERSNSAGNLGANTLCEGDNSNANVQAKLQYLLEQIQAVVLGQIPDGTITTPKLANSSVTQNKLSNDVLNVINSKINQENFDVIGKYNPVVNTEEGETEILGTGNVFTSRTGTTYSATYDSGSSPANAFQYTSSSSNYYYLGNKTAGTYSVEAILLEKARINELNVVILPTGSSSQSSASAFQNYKIIGTKDDNTEVILYEKSNWNDLPHEYTKIQLNNADFYKKYRIEIAKGTTTNINEGYYVQVYTDDYIDKVEKNNTLILNSNIPEYRNQMKVSIKTPDNITNSSYFSLNINNLGEKVINGILKANKNYDLIYNGTSFDVVDNVIIGQFTAEASGVKTNVTLGFSPKFVIFSYAENYDAGRAILIANAPIMYRQHYILEDGFTFIAENTTQRKVINYAAYK